MLKAWNRRVRMTSAMANAVATVRMVSAHPPCRRFSSLDTVIGREGSGLATRQPLSWIKRYHIPPRRRAHSTPATELGSGTLIARGWEAAVAACPHRSTLAQRRLLERVKGIEPSSSAWKAVALSFRPRSFHCTKSLFLQALPGWCTAANGQEIFTPIHGVTLPRRHPGGAAVMPTKSLTELFVARVKPPAQGRVEYFDAAFPGLALRVTANGSKSWCTFYRFKGRLRRFTIGAYPAIKPAQARREAITALERLRQGVDPAEEKRTRRTP